MIFLPIPYSYFFLIFHNLTVITVPVTIFLNISTSLKKLLNHYYKLSWKAKKFIKAMVDIKNSKDWLINQAV